MLSGLKDTRNKLQHFEPMPEAQCAKRVETCAELLHNLDCADAAAAVRARCVDVRKRCPRDGVYVWQLAAAPAAARHAQQRRVAATRDRFFAGRDDDVAKLCGALRAAPGSRILVQGAPRQLPPLHSPSPPPYTASPRAAGAVFAAEASVAVA